MRHILGLVEGLIGDFSPVKVRVAPRKLVELSIIPIDQVRPHEDTVPSFLDAIRRDMRRTGYQRDPILIDKKTHVALDGMHRRAALISLHAKYAVCAEYDYLGQSVALERWLRYFVGPDDDLLSSIISVFNMKPCPNFREAVRTVDAGRSSLALLSNRESYVSKENWNMLEMYRMLSEVDELFAKNDIEIDFVPESNKFNLFSSESVFVLYPPKLSKRNVLEIARKHAVLPYKTTRHVVPIRPMGIYFPLECLKNSTRKECDEELHRIVNLSKVHVEQRHVWYEGRRYSEPLAIFRRGPQTSSLS